MERNFRRKIEILNKSSVTADSVNITVPATAPDKMVSVIKLVVKGKVEKANASGTRKKMQSEAID